jgi:hypothetical protein
MHHGSCIQITSKHHHPDIRVIKASRLWHSDRHQRSRFKVSSFVCDQQIALRPGTAGTCAFTTPLALREILAGFHHDIATFSTGSCRSEIISANAFNLSAP